MEQRTLNHHSLCVCDDDEDEYLKYVCSMCTVLNCFNCLSPPLCFPGDPQALFMHLLATFVVGQPSVS
jgi:hypothetical protein